MYKAIWRCYNERKSFTFVHLIFNRALFITSEQYLRKDKPVSNSNAFSKVLREMGCFTRGLAGCRYVVSNSAPNYGWLK